jgi:hypothetical protein
MRTEDDAYWTMSLPKDHEALQVLDAYCKEWGGLSRAEATRRLLIEWSKLYQGQSISPWLAASPTQPVGSVLPQPAPGASSKPVIASRSAKAASQMLDED